MLQTAIEIEGLIRIIRDGNPLPETYKLLQDKVAALSDYASNLNIQSQPSPTVEIAFEGPADETEPDLEEEEGTEVGEQMPEVSEQRSEVGDQRSEDTEEETDEDTDEDTEEDEIMLSFETEDDDEISLQPKPIEPVEQPKFGKKKESRLKAAFSLNDRFLYSRELFEGNMKSFDSTLDFIEGVDDFSVIEEYFYNELEWDPENRHVASFMEILRPHFKE